VNVAPIELLLMANVSGAVAVSEKLVAVLVPLEGLQTASRIPCCVELDGLTVDSKHAAPVRPVRLARVLLTPTPDALYDVKIELRFPVTVNQNLDPWIVRPVA